MSNRNFLKMLKAQWSRGNFVCIGLDPDTAKMPDHLRKDVRLSDRMIRIFCKQIIEATKDLVCAYKPNSAFFEGIGVNGEDVLSYVIGTIRDLAPDVPVILDAKRGDVYNPNIGYVELAFTWLKADAITINPYLGAEALQPFITRAEKGIIVLCRTSNPGAGEFQDLLIEPNLDDAKKWGLAWDSSDRNPDPCWIIKKIPLYQYVAYRVSREWNKNGNCALVVGATYPEELWEVRQIVGNMPILIPGVGFQQKDVSLEEQVKQVVNAGKDSHGQGMIINSSRGIIFASKGADFADAARRETIKLHNLINKYR